MAEMSEESRAGSESASGRARATTRSAGDNRGRKNAPDLKRDLRDFASARPAGWGHDDWLNFLESLKSRGHDVHDRDAIGIALEKERLDLALSGTKGMGPQRRQALVDRYATIWNLRKADAAEIASVARIPRDLAERVKADLP